MPPSSIDLDKYRLRRFVDRLNDMGEVEVHEEPVPLTHLSSIIEGTRKAVLFKQAGPERVELVAKTGGNRKRLAAAFGVSESKLPDTYLQRLADSSQEVVEVGSGDAPVQQVKLTGKDVDLTRLPFHPQHAHDGSCYMSSAIDFTIDPATGRRNVGCRRLSLRNARECGTNVTAPSDLKRIYTATVARGERLPISFTVGNHPLDFVAATTRTPSDELARIASFRGERMPVVKSLTNDILVPADAELVLEGYLDERGYVEPEGPYGEYMGYYGSIHMDPVFHCTAITMRKDVLHHTLLHGSAFVMDQTDSNNITAMRCEAETLEILRKLGVETVAVSSRSFAGGSSGLRVSIRQKRDGEARDALKALFEGIHRIKHVYIYDDDIDIADENQIEWAMGTRFQAHRDLMVFTGLKGMTMDPSLNGEKTGAKAGFDCTMPVGRRGEIPMTRCAAKTFKGPARWQTVEQALESQPMFYADIVEGLGSDDGREIACRLDELRVKGRLGRDRDGRYHLVKGKPGVTGIVGDLYHDPNDGA